MTFLDKLKLANLASGIFFIVIGILQIISLSALFSSISFSFFMTIFLPFFLVGFGVLMLASTQKIEFIDKYFKFLTTFLGRGLFNLFLASVSVYQLTSSTSSIIGFIIGTILFILGSIFVVLHFTQKNSQYDDYREQLQA